jgi:hypothetical protein
MSTSCRMSALNRLGRKLDGYRCCVLVFLARTAAVVYTPVSAISRPEFTASVKAW